MAPGVAKPFPRERMVESVDNRGNYKIPRDQFRRNETGWNSLPYWVNCLGFGMKRLRHQSRDKREILYRVTIENSIVYRPYYQLRYKKGGI